MTLFNSTLKKMRSALAYINAGKYRTTRQRTSKMDAVSIVNPADLVPASVETDPPHGTGRRRVAMYLGSVLPPAVMEYIVQTCGRLDHDLTVLTFENDHIASGLLAPYREVLQSANINMITTHLSGEPIQGLVRYLRNHPDITFLACKDSGYLGRAYMKGAPRKNALPVPVVVVVTQSDV